MRRSPSPPRRSRLSSIPCSSASSQGFFQTPAKKDGAPGLVGAATNGDASLPPTLPSTGVATLPSPPSALLQGGRLHRSAPPPARQRQRSAPFLPRRAVAGERGGGEDGRGGRAVLRERAALQPAPASSGTGRTQGPPAATSCLCC